MSSDDTVQRRGGGEGDAALRYHLNLLHGLRPIPDDVMRLIHEFDRRVRTRTS